MRAGSTPPKRTTPSRLKIHNSTKGKREKNCRRANVSILCQFFVGGFPRRKNSRIPTERFWLARLFVCWLVSYLSVFSGQVVYGGRAVRHEHHCLNCQLLFLPLTPFPHPPPHSIFFSFRGWGLRCCTMVMGSWPLTVAFRFRNSQRHFRVWVWAGVGGGRRSYQISLQTYASLKEVRLPLRGKSKNVISELARIRPGSRLPN